MSDGLGRGTGLASPRTPHGFPLAGSQQPSQHGHGKPTSEIGGQEAGRQLQPFTQEGAEG